MQLTRNVDEQLRDTTKGVGDSLPPSRDGRDKTGINTGWVGTGVVTARVGLVGVVLQDGVGDTTQGADEETSGDTGNGAVVNLGVAEKGVQAVLWTGKCQWKAQGNWQRLTGGKQLTLRIGPNRIIESELKLPMTSLVTPVVSSSLPWKLAEEPIL